MAMGRFTGAAIRRTLRSLGDGTSHLSRRQFHASSGDSKKIVGVFYKANEYASKNPNFLGCVENALGIRSWLESQGHHYIVTDDKEGPDCELEKHIPDLHVVISTPFHPAYVTAERIKKAKNLQLLLTAGIGSDHIDLQAAAAAGLTVAEVTGSNVVSVAEDELMRILILMRNFVPGYNQVVNGEWNVAGIAYRAYDLEGKTVGTVGAGRIGKLLLQRLKPFGCNLLYHDRLQMGPEMEKETGAKYVESLNEMLPKCDVVVVNTPLTEKTRGMFNKEMIGKMKKGVLIVNNARGAIMDRQAVVEAVESGHIGGYSGDVWDPQPAPKDHPWRYMPNQAMTPHISGTTIDAQLRYAAGTKDMLEKYFKGEDFPAQNYIVKDGELAPQYRIGKLLLQRLKPFGCNLLYHDRLQMGPEMEKETGAKYVESLNEMLPKCDVVVVNTPLTEKTRGMFNKEMIGKMKKGVLIVNNARGAIMDRQAVVEAVESGHIGGYSGDVWDPQPAPKDHPWRYMVNQAMTPHISGTTIDAQLRYAAGTKDMLEKYFKGEDFPAQNYIVKDGELAPQYR